MIVSHRAHQLGMAGWLSLRDHFAFAMISDILCVLGGNGMGWWYVLGMKLWPSCLKANILSFKPSFFC